MHRRVRCFPGPGSDYLLDALGFDPANVHKRLGDGYYEQKRVREQIGELTGRRFLTGYSSDEEQFRALMNAGALFAQQLGLRPGVALSAEQMAQLTSDIVWLVEQTVTLADGSTQTVQGGGFHQYGITRVDRVAGLYVTHPGGPGVLNVDAGGDVTLRKPMMSALDWRSTAARGDAR